MIVVVKCYEYGIRLLVVEVFEGHDEQTQIDAANLANILSRKDGHKYRVLIDITCTDM